MSDCSGPGELQEISSWKLRSNVSNSPGLLVTGASSVEARDDGRIIIDTDRLGTVCRADRLG